MARAPVPSAGYSGKPLADKLGFRPGWRVGLLDAPDAYLALVHGTPGVTFAPIGDLAECDAAHLFLYDPDEIATAALGGIERLRAGGMLWLSWAKKSSPSHAGVTEDLLRDRVLPLGWVDVKVCAVDADWSALKFLKRR